MPVKEEKIPQQELPPVKKPDVVVEAQQEATPVVTEKKTALQTLPEEKKAVQEIPKEQTQPRAAIPNSDCTALASEDDFMKLRKKMAAENNDDDMVTVARKSFKTKCFTVAQIKNLSVLFLNDKGKYQFFDAAYPFVSDSYNFITLQSLLSDEYYVNRFKAMLRH